MKEITVKAYAKINVFLDVYTNVVRDTMHILKTQISKIDLFDIINIKKNLCTTEITVSYLDGTIFASDNALKMAKKIQTRFALCGFDINIDKKIPVGGGLGGSSADAVGVAKALEKLFDLKEIPMDILTSVGSDILAMYKYDHCFLEGIGNMTKKIDKPSFGLVCVLLPIQSETKDVFKWFENSKKLLFSIDKVNKCGKILGENNLYPIVANFYPQIKNTYDFLRRIGFSDVSMTGSGSTIFATDGCKEKFNDLSKNLLKYDGLTVLLTKTL